MIGDRTHEPGSNAIHGFRAGNQAWTGVAGLLAASRSNSSTNAWLILQSSGVKQGMVLRKSAKLLQPNLPFCMGVSCNQNELLDHTLRWTISKVRQLGIAMLLRTKQNPSVQTGQTHCGLVELPGAWITSSPETGLYMPR
jgi:hypothetical protein